jgi:hypothetical protein
VEMTTSTLTPVLALSDANAESTRLFLWDEPALRSALRTEDHLMYRAERDVAPPRTVPHRAGGAVLWRADRVIYGAGDLPTGELNRSVGHWNPGDQWEIFHTDSGCIALVVRPHPDAPVVVVVCSDRQVVAVPPGSWHLTYVFHGPATVTNLYSRTPGTPDAETKYFSRPTVRVGLRREGGQLVTFGPDEDTARVRWRAGAAPPVLLGVAGDLIGLLHTDPPPELLTDPGTVLGAAALDRLPSPDRHVRGGTGASP